MVEYVSNSAIMLDDLTPINSFVDIKRWETQRLTTYDKSIGEESPADLLCEIFRDARWTGKPWDTGEILI